MMRLAVALILVVVPGGIEPPYSGTIFIDPDIVTSEDPSTFTGATYTGQGIRLMFDRRVDMFVYYDAYLFDATFSDGLTAEIQVNPEFNSPAAAMVPALQYGLEIGRLAYALRTSIQTVWIHQGVQPFGGGNNNILVHTGQGAQYSAMGILEEALIHEASHTSLDAAHAASPGWLDAQVADPGFISDYAQDHQTEEDIAESFLTWVAVRYRRNRISLMDANTILSTIPNRLAYFDDQNFNMAPFPGPRRAVRRSVR